MCRYVYNVPPYKIPRSAMLFCGQQKKYLAKVDHFKMNVRKVGCEVDETGGVWYQRC